MNTSVQRRTGAIRLRLAANTGRAPGLVQFVVRHYSSSPRFLFDTNCGAGTELLGVHVNGIMDLVDRPDVVVRSEP
jgi:hypothetical protein